MDSSIELKLLIIHILYSHIQVGIYNSINLKLRKLKEFGGYVDSTIDNT